jgi:hypothetical protein
VVTFRWASSLTKLSITICTDGLPLPLAAESAHCHPCTINAACITPPQQEVFTSQATSRHGHCHCHCHCHHHSTAQHSTPPHSTAQHTAALHTSHPHPHPNASHRQSQSAPLSTPQLAPARRTDTPHSARHHPRGVHRTAPTAPASTPRTRTPQIATTRSHRISTPRSHAAPAGRTLRTLAACYTPPYAPAKRIHIRTTHDAHNHRTPQDATRRYISTLPQPHLQLLPHARAATQQRYP